VHGTVDGVPDRATFATSVKQSTGKDLTPLIDRRLDSKTSPAV
jgi:hypothetical protein